jgi:MYXO-CTERM domain-containing protein
MLGADSQVLNSEITDCDIGMMLSGEGSLVQGNYIHHLIMGVDAAPGVDPNMVGGAEGIFINASNNEVSYNAFVNCIGGAEWVGGNGGCDGGATEVTVRAGETLAGVRVHHNFSYNNCGFLEIATGFGDAKGVFADSAFYNNVTIDSGWMGLLQVNNTDLSNIEFYNNTLVQRQDSPNAGLLWIIFTDTSSGMTGGELVPGTVSLINNLFVFDGVTTWGDPIDAAFDQTTNLIINTADQDPGFLNLSGTSATDFDLTASSPAIDVGTLIANNTLDYLNRAVPDPSGLTDIGAFEYGATEGTGGNTASGGTAGGSPDSGGSSGSGGSGTGGSAQGGGSGGVAAGTATGGNPATPTGGAAADSTQEESGCSCTIAARETERAFAWTGLLGLLLLGGRRIRRSGRS